MNVADWIQRARDELDNIGLEQVKDSGILPDRGAKFFPVIGYPPLTMFSELDQTPFFENFQQRPAAPTVAYAHIPFCPTQCTFCHWITKTRSPEQEVDIYLDYLDREMQLYKQNMGVDAIPVQSVLIGGGTPTYLTPAQMERFLKSFTTHFDLSDCTQFSVEAEPRTLLGADGLAKLRIMKDYGVHRISMGVQSFDDPILRYMGRTHNRGDTLDAIAQMRTAGIENIMIDLIYAYPNQTPETWAQNMLIATELDVEGWQLYRLRIKPHGDRQGSIVKHFEKRPERFAEADKIFLMKMLGILISEEHGYAEHQTRVFARKADDISHYLRDWTSRLTDVAGVGVSSWSNMRGRFAINVGDKKLSDYYSLIDQGKVAINRGKVRTDDDEMRRSFILPLKNMQVSKAEFETRVGRTVHQCFGDEIAWLKELDMLREDDAHINLTPRGRFFADEICTQFFNPEYLPFPEVARAPTRASGGN